MQSMVLPAWLPLLSPLLALLWPSIVPALTMSSTDTCLHAKHPAYACDDARSTAGDAVNITKDGPIAH